MQKNWTRTSQHDRIIECFIRISPTRIAVEYQCLRLSWMLSDSIRLFVQLAFRLSVITKFEAYYLHLMTNHEFIYFYFIYFLYKIDCKSAFSLLEFLLSIRHHKRGRLSTLRLLIFANSSSIIWEYQRFSFQIGLILVEVSKRNWCKEGGWYCWRTSSLRWLAASAANAVAWNEVIRKEKNCDKTHINLIT